MCNALYAEIKDLPPRDMVRGVAAIATETYLGNRVRTVKHKFLNTAKEKAVVFAQKIGEKLTNKAPILQTPDGMQVRIADKMTKYHCKFSEYDKSSPANGFHEKPQLPSTPVSDKNVIKKILEHGPAWDMPDGGKIINGRFYTKHVLERMAPSTSEVIEELERRAIKRGLVKGSDEFNDYIKPPNIPPSVIEKAIISGRPKPGKTIHTKIFENDSVKVIINSNGDVVTVYAKGKKP